MIARRRNSASLYAVNATSSVITTLISMSALVWVNQYLIRRVSPDEYALFPVIASLLVIAELFPIVFLRGLARFMVEADARNDSHALKRIVSSMSLVLIPIAGLLFGAGILATVRIDDIISVAPENRSDAQIMLMLLLTVLCFRVASTPFRLGLHVRMRFVEQNLVLLATEVLRISILLILLLGIGAQVLWIAVASSTANLVNVAIMIIYTVRILPDARFERSSVSVETIKRLLSFSLWTLCQGLNNLVLKAVPALLLNRHSSALDVSAFHVGSLADTQIRRLVVAAATPAKPALTAIYAVEGETPLQSFYYRGGRYYLWASLFLVPPLLVFAYPLINLYVGERYLQAATVMIVLLSVYPFTWASGMFYEIAYSVGRIKAFNFCILILSLMALAGMWYFVVERDMGATGAALGLGGASVVVYLLIMWPAGLWLVKGSWGVFVSHTLAPGLAPFATSILGCYIFGKIYSIESWFGLFAGFGLSTAIYLIVLFVTCLDDVDRVLMKRMRAKIKFRMTRKQDTP